MIFIDITWPALAVMLAFSHLIYHGFTKALFPPHESDRHET